MATPGFQEFFESRIKNHFYVRRNSYMATLVKHILLPLATEMYISSTYLCH